MVIDLSRRLHHRATKPQAKPIGRVNGPQVTGRRNTGGGFKKHGHEASRCICNRNMWKAGANIIWTTV